MKTKNRFVNILVLAFVVPVTLMALISASKETSKVTLSRPEGPCDIYAAGGTPCVAAHSTTRALYATYNGPLYQVIRQSDGKTLDIGVVQPKEGDLGGYADAAIQDAFCANTICLITKIYDQSGKGNHLMQAAPGTFKGTAKGGFNNLPIADMAPISINGHKTFGVYIIPGMGLRNNNAKDIAINDEPEGIYYVIDGKHYDSGCCFDYGNSSTNGRAVGTGTMETTYYGTATAWGSGNGPGPWIMTDLEAGLFTGYNAKKNDVPSIDSWRFVSVFVDGGGGNKWDLRGGNVQKDKLTTFYSGIRPGTPNKSDYYPMNKKGGILLGNGGDNGNGSAGTFYEGVMTIGFPTEATTNAVHANIVAARYDVQQVSLSRVTSFTPKSIQNITETFTNTTGMPIKDLKFSVLAPEGWIVLVEGTNSPSKVFSTQIQPGESISTTFKITSPETTGAGYLTGKAEWTKLSMNKSQSETVSQRVRNVFPVKINEVCFGSGAEMTNQFIELYNASDNEMDISNWNIVSTPSEWAAVNLVTIPADTKIVSKGFYLLGLSSSGLVAPAKQGENIVNVRSTAGFEVGQQININGELCKVVNVGTPASPMTTLFIPVSTGPWLTFPAGSTNLPVTNASGFVIGQKIGTDLGGNYEIATITWVGKAATQTNLAAAAKEGDTTIKVATNSNMTVGDTLIISTGARKEIALVKEIVKVSTSVGGGFSQVDNSNANVGEVELSAPLKLNHMLSVDVSDRGTGISFSPETRFIHKSGDAVQALGSGITLEKKLAKKHEFGAPVINALNTTAGYQGSKNPNQLYGNPFSASAGSIALKDVSGALLVDAIVYGSQQSSSSANGTIASPEIATLEGNQSQGGNIIVTPTQRRGQFASGGVQPIKSAGRFPDGADTDNNINDFFFQNAINLLIATEIGSTNIKVASVFDLIKGQKIVIGSGNSSETAVIASVGTAGGTAVRVVTNAGSKVILVASAEGFNIGQAITIDNGANQENSVVSSIAVAMRRFGGQRNSNPMDTITVANPLKFGHIVGVPVSGSGITLTAPLNKTHGSGSPVANNVPTPGEPNLYIRKNK
ncbi:MAG TPA: arabinofuranosidase catalytic domain-containing protein [Paludibacter sp.]